MNFRVCAVVVTTLLAVAPRVASAAEITIMSSTAATYLTDLSDASRVAGSAGAPLLHDSIVGGTAEADYFRVFASTTSYGLGDPFTVTGTPMAVADVATVFTPHADGLADLVIALTTGGSSSSWSEGSIALWNLTTSQEVFNYGWDALGTGSIWRPPTYNHTLFDVAFFGTPLTVSTQLNASSRYLLMMHTQTQASGDAQLINLSMSGLQASRAVPEPSTLILSALAASLVAVRRRRRHM
jgi:hypothetical protein